METTKTKTKIKGPQDGILRAKRIHGSSGEFSTSVSEKKPVGLLLLSIHGNRRCQGEYLAALLEFAMSCYNKVEVLITDEPHSNNWRGLTISPEEQVELIAKAKLQGDQYLDENLPYLLSPIKRRISSFSVSLFKFNFPNKSDWISAMNAKTSEYNLPIQFFRWQQWIASSEFYSKNREDITSLYQSSPVLEEALTDSVTAHIKAVKSRPFHPMDSALIALTDENQRNDLLIIRSRGYLKTECPAIYYIAAKHEVNDIIYPGKQPKIFKVSHDFFIREILDESAHPLALKVDNPEYVANWVSIDFERERLAHSPIQFDHGPVNPAAVKNTKIPGDRSVFSPRIDPKSRGLSLFLPEETLQNTSRFEARTSLRRTKSCPPPIEAINTNKSETRYDLEKFGFTIDPQEPLTKFYVVLPIQMAPGMKMLLLEQINNAILLSMSSMPKTRYLEDFPVEKMPGGRSSFGSSF